MMYPRAMNNNEKAALKMIKDSKLAYEIKFSDDRYGRGYGGYQVNVPALKSTFILSSSNFSKDFTRFTKAQKASE